MVALVLEELHQPFILKEMPGPVPGPGEVLVQLKAAALNHRDVWIQKGQYAGIRLPAILGSDGAGVVIELGEGVGSYWQGKEVILNPGIHWGNNPTVQNRSFKILGMPEPGTFAQYVKIPATNLVAKPAHLSWEQAAALPLAGITGYRALISRAQVRPFEKVLITGIGGGVALQVLQFAVSSGAQVYVTSGSDEKIQQAMALGAQGGANYRQADWPELLKSQAAAFDVIIDSVAGDAFVKLIDLAAEGGRIAMYGGTQGVMNGLVPGRIFWKQLSIFGSTMGSESEFQAMVAFVETHQITPVVSQVFSLQTANEAIQYMKDSAQFGKIALQIR